MSNSLPIPRCIVAGSILLATACVGRPHSRSAEPAISVDERELRAWMSAIADDSMQGRAAGSVGHERAVRYLVDQLTRIGLTPAGESGGFIQRVPELMLVVDTLTELRSMPTGSRSAWTFGPSSTVEDSHGRSTASR